MNTREQCIGGGCIAILLLAGAAVAAEPPKLQNNPFSRPLSAVSFDVPGIRNDAKSNRGSLNLHATMVSGATKLANVNGQVMRQGDEFNGYTLLRIYEDRAIFQRSNKQTILYVKPKPEQKDENLTED